MFFVGVDIGGSKIELALLSFSKNIIMDNISIKKAGTYLVANDYLPKE